MLVKIMDFFKKLGWKKISKILIVIVYSILLVLITHAIENTYFNKVVEKDAVVVAPAQSDAVLELEVLEKTLKENSQLSTAKLKFKGEAEYSGKGIPGITKNEFVVLFEATVKAGIDINNVKIEGDKDNKIIYITVPDAKIEPDDVYINHNTLRFFDKKFVLFPVDVSEATAEALALSEKVANEYAQEMGIIEMADKQSAQIIKGILVNVIPDGYKIKIKNTK